MQFSPLTVVDISQQSNTALTGYLNIPLTHINDHIVRMSVMTAPFYWHYHPNSDETFLVIEGILIIDLETTTITLQPGQLFTIPQKVKHRTRPQGERSVNLTFEAANIETVRLAADPA